MVNIMKNKKDFLIIPNDVAFDTKLSSSAKLLYAEIAYLCNIEGFCWASNGYLGRLFGIDNRTVQRLLRQLKDKGYIFFDTPDKNVAPYDKNVANIRQICLTPRDKNVIQSNKNNRNKNSYKKKSEDFSAYDLDLYEEMLRNND